MANWLINLNWKFHSEIWQNCRRNRRAAIGWGQDSDDDLKTDNSYQRASGYFKKIEAGDCVVAFLKDYRLGCWGTVTKPYNKQIFEPQLAAKTEEADFGRIIHVRWENVDTPPINQAARMRPEDVRGFNCRWTINPLKSPEVFERLKRIIKNRSRWEAL
jgi:hypothetical protein